MSENKKHSTLTIRILGRDYPVSCPEDEREALLTSAEHLSKRMQAIQKKGKALGTDRVAVMAALNTTRELVALQQEVAQMRHQAQADDASLVDSTQLPAQQPADSGYDERLAQLQERIESALDEAPDST